MTTHDPETGAPWDLNDGRVRTKAMNLVKEGKPYMLICSPMCTAFSQIQALNVERRDPAIVRRELDNAKDHVRWTMKLCALQVREGRYFLFEHPKTATSCKMAEVERVATMKGVEKIRTDMCEFGMCSKDEDGVGLVKKPTTMMTNSPEVGRRLSKKCQNSDVPDGEKHRHVKLINGRASHAQVYPRALCRAVCEGVAAQKRIDSMNLVAMNLMTMQELNSFGTDELHENPEDLEAFDDVSGDELKVELVVAARAEELKYV